MNRVWTPITAAGGEVVVLVFASRYLDSEEGFLVLVALCNIVILLYGLFLPKSGPRRRSAAVACGALTRLPPAAPVVIGRRRAGRARVEPPRSFAGWKLL